MCLKNFLLAVDFKLSIVNRLSLRFVVKSFRFFFVSIRDFRDLVGGFKGGQDEIGFRGIGNGYLFLVMKKKIFFFKVRKEVVLGYMEIISLFVSVKGSVKGSKVGLENSKIEGLI